MYTLEQIRAREGAYTNVNGIMTIVVTLDDGRVLAREIAGYNSYEEYLALREQHRQWFLDEANRGEQQHDYWNAYDQSDTGEGEQPSLTPLLDSQ